MLLTDLKNTRFSPGIFFADNLSLDTRQSILIFESTQCRGGAPVPARWIVGRRSPSIRL